MITWSNPIAIEYIMKEKGVGRNRAKEIYHNNNEYYDHLCEVRRKKADEHIKHLVEELEQRDKIIREFRNLKNNILEYIDSREWENPEDCMNKVYDMLKGE